MPRSIRILVVVGVCLGVTLGTGQGAGDGADPAAAATPVECGAVLSTPGKYVLTHDLTCVGTAITIKGDNVQFDMNGFDVTGVDGISTGIIVGDVLVDFCFPMNAPLVELRATGGGTISGYGTGLFLCRVEGARVNGLTLTGNREGIFLDGAHSAKITRNNISSNKSFGIKVASLRLARIEGNTITNNHNVAFCQKAPFSCGGVEIFASGDGMTVRNNTISGNGDVGLWLRDSRQMTVENNTVTNTNSLGVPTTNIAITGNSDNNTIQGNTTGATVLGTSADGINVGCKAGCAFISGPTSGANSNVIQSNIANNNARYGIAQASGNTGNTYQGNTATGNLVANFAIDP